MRRIHVGAKRPFPAIDNSGIYLPLTTFQRAINPENMADPFGSRTRVIHHALSSHEELPFDIYEPMFDWFFHSQHYQSWSRGEKPWQLHCVGAPGSGKVFNNSCAAFVD